MFSCGNAIGQLMQVERIAGELGMKDRLHLWPDKSLKSKPKFLEVRRDAFAEKYPDAEKLQIRAARKQDDAAYATFEKWIDGWHARISAWPKAGGNNHE